MQPEISEATLKNISGQFLNATTKNFVVLDARYTANRQNVQ